MTKFEIGKEYRVHSICNHECVWVYKVIARTAQTITIDSKGEIKKCRISKKDSEYFNQEIVYPEGKYSMCPVLRA